MKAPAFHAARLLLIGGEPLPAPRHVYWNFVSSSLERIEQAKSDWRQGHLPMVPGEAGFIPLPEDRWDDRLRRGSAGTSRRQNMSLMRTIVSSSISPSNQTSNMVSSRNSWLPASEKSVSDACSFFESSPPNTV